MNICEYKKKVRAQLDEIMEKPVTLGRMEEAGIMAGLLYSLDALHGEHAETFTEADARAWVARMENEDGSTGGHWTQDQTAAAARSVGMMGTPEWYAAMNMMYSDYSEVAKEFSVDRPDFYAKMAKAFLMDKDAGGAEEKTAAYYHCVAKSR